MVVATFQEMQLKVVKIFEKVVQGSLITSLNEREVVSLTATSRFTHRERPFRSQQDAVSLYGIITQKLELRRSCPALFVKDKKNVMKWIE